MEDDMEKGEGSASLAAASSQESSIEDQEDPFDQPMRRTVRKRAPLPSPYSPSPPRKQIKKGKKGQPKHDDEESYQPPAAEGDDEEEYYSDSSSLVSEDPPFAKERAGIYAPLFRFRQKRQTDCIPLVRLPPRVIGGVRDQFEKTKVCNCKRSNCLKLYCDCFMAGLYCNGACNCINCRNNDQHPRERNLAIDMALVRNANSFRTQLQTMRSSTSTTSGNDAIQTSSVTTRGKGCHCKKSSCLKKYCECFLARAYCSSHCQCKGCKNKVGNPERERLFRKRHGRRAQSEAGATTLARHHTRTRVHRDDQQESVTGNVRAAGTESFGVGRGEMGAGIDDLLLPPSTYAVPMTVGGSGRVYPALAFTITGYGQGRLSPAQNGGASQAERTPKSQSSPGSPSSAAVTADDDDMCVKHETQLEKLWRIEGKRAWQTFCKIREDIQSTCHNGAPADIASERNESAVDYRARVAMDNVAADVKDIAIAMRKAEAIAMSQFDSASEEAVVIGQTTENVPESSEGLGTDPEAALICMETIPMASDEHSGAYQTNRTTSASGSKSPTDMVDESLLLCDETIEETSDSEADQSSSEQGTVDRQVALLLCKERIESLNDQELTEDAVRELTVLASQEAALLRQLAGIMRRKTIEMTKQRTRLVEEVRRQI